MALNWADERFVKMYTRDTVNWVRLSYDARSLFMHLIRKVDRAGVLEVGVDGEEGIAALLAAPLDTVRTALVELRDRGTIQVKDGNLVIPNFLEAQESRMSDSLRQSELRARRRDTARHTATGDVTGCHTALESVTPRLDKTRLEDPNGVVEYLNQVSGRSFRVVAPTMRLINARLAEGHTAEDLKLVIDLKCKEWSNDPSMSKYIRPETLFGATKFQGYVAAAKAIKAPKNFPPSKPFFVPQLVTPEVIARRQEVAEELSKLVANLGVK